MQSSCIFQISENFLTHHHICRTLLTNDSVIALGATLVLLLFLLFTFMLFYFQVELLLIIYLLNYCSSLWTHHVSLLSCLPLVMAFISPLD